MTPRVRCLARAVSGLLAALLLGAPARASGLGGLASWAAFYGEHAPLSALQAPDLLVLEPDHPWEPASIRRPGQKLLAYLSLGEVNRSRPYFAELARDRKALAGENPNWPGAVMVDPRVASWRSLVLDRIAPKLLARGYDGLFLDTLDVAAELERRGKHPGATAAMVSLVNELKSRFPKALLVANGGLDLLSGASSAFSAVAVESVLTDYDFKGKHYRLRADEPAAQRVKQLQAIAQRYALPLLALEYVAPQDETARAAVAQQLRQAGFVPFVSDIGLASLLPLPGEGEARLPEEASAPVPPDASAP